MALARLRKALSWRYRRFVQRQGYVVMTVVCAAVIAGSAAWTQQAGFRHVPDTPAPNAASAADLWQQSLQDAVTDAPDANDEPAWLSPVKEAVLMREFDPDRLVPSDIPGLWRVHDAADLTADESETVIAMRAGMVTEAAAGRVVIDHGDGYIAEYAGLRDVTVQTGDSLRMGDDIGRVGHIHGQEGLCLRVTRNGEPVDPLLLLEADFSDE